MSTSSGSRTSIATSPPPVGSTREPAGTNANRSSSERTPSVFESVGPHAEHHASARPATATNVRATLRASTFPTGLGGKAAAIRPRLARSGARRRLLGARRLRIGDEDVDAAVALLVLGRVV